ncbi:kinase-like protein, partial [Rhodotorula sp. JG-1b]
LGRGSYATVEKAVDRETGEEYAIKEFSKRRLRQIAAAEALRRERLSRIPSTEVAIMKKVDHPNLASVHEVIDVTSDDALLMMELCHGGPILKIKDGQDATPYSEEEARQIFRQLVLGIAYLHHNEIIHRDIKPDNALFADEAKTHVKLVDFGVSKFAAGPSPTTAPKVSVAGSPAYMAPELLPGGRGDQVKEAEFCGIGVTLYTLVTGRLPFRSDDPVEMFERIREGK